MKCENCGSELTADSIFCNICGKPVGEISESDGFDDDILFDPKNESTSEGSQDPSEMTKPSKTSQDEKKKRGIKLPIVIAALFFCVMFLGIVLFLISGVGESAQDKYITALAKLDRAIAENNFGDAEEYYAETNECFGELPETKASDRYSLLQRELSIKAGTSDLFGEINTLEELIKLAEEEGYLSDVRDYYGRLLTCSESAGDNEKLDMLIRKLSDSDDEALRELVIGYKPKAPVFGTVGDSPRPGDTVSVDCEDDCVICYSSSKKKIKEKKNTGSCHDEISLKSGENVRYAYSMNVYGLCSDIVTFSYELSTVYDVPMPVVSPHSGEYDSEFKITVDVPEGLTAYYCWNETPDENSAKYIAPVFAIEGNNVFSVIYIDEYGNKSNVQRINYIYLKEDITEQEPEPDIDALVNAIDEGEDAGETRETHENIISFD